ncbi:MAG: HDOD domain-containing protein [Planctomycetota bacterium]|nr:MAG: HDOD domain-containing protein [Planctomycetota bacterium]
MTADDRGSSLAVLGGPVTHPQAQQVRRVELILQQLEELPTLSAVAVRLLDLTTSETSEAKEVIDLVASDPALASKVLKLCRCHSRGRASIVKSIDRAVILLGFEAVRSAVLSVQVLELFDGVESAGRELRKDPPVFDRKMFWQHCLAVGITCEMLVEGTSLRGRMSRGEAYVSGLLHDLGQLVLHLVMPESFDRVIELAESQGVPLDQACRQVIGIDSHTAGKRLAEHWHLPNSLGDVLWLHGQPFDSLPDLPHREMIELVSLADVIVKKQHITTVGHTAYGEDVEAMCGHLGIDPAIVEEITPKLLDEVEVRANSLGLDVETSTEMLLRSVSRANEVLGRLNAGMRQRAENAETQARVLTAISEFHAAAMPSGSVVSVLGKVVESAAKTFTEGFFGMLYQGRNDQPWQFFQFASDGRVLRSDLIARHFAPESVDELGDDMQVSMQALGLLPWLSDYLADARNIRDVRLLALKCGWGVSAVLFHELPLDGRSDRLHLEALSRTWGAAIAASAQHQGAKRLGEELAETNRMLTGAQDELARSKALAALGEIAAGVAHEMNNPLAIISGRSQLLATRLKDPELKPMAQQIVERTHELSDMITALRSFAEPASPVCRLVNIAELLGQVVDEINRKSEEENRVKLVVDGQVPALTIDPEQITRVVQELVRNALEAAGSAQVEVRVQIDTLDDRLNIQVRDDGPGLSDHALTHAFDPFFSEKPAGRQPGLGLAVARQLVDAHGGRLTLENGSTGGAVATIRLHIDGDQRKRGVA